MNENNTELHKKTNIKMLIGVFAVIFCLLIVFFITFYVNFGKIADKFIDIDFIKTAVNKNTGLILDLEKPKIYTTNDFCINLISKKAALFSPDNKENPLLNILDIETKVQIFPLFFKKIEIKKLSCANIDLYILRDKEGKINFTKYIKNGSKFPFKFSIQNADISCSKYLVKFIDEIHLEKVYITGFNLFSSEFDLKKKSNIKTNGHIKFVNSNSEQISPYTLDLRLKFPLSKNFDFKDYKFHLSVSNLDFSYIYPYINEFVSKDIKDFKGKANLSVVPCDTMLDFKFDLEDIFLKIYKNNHNNFIDIPKSSKLAFKTAFQKDMVLIKDFKFLKEGIDISAEGSLANISNAKNLKPDLTFTFKDTSLSNTLKIIPDYLVKMQQDYIPLLKKHNVNGVVNGKITIKNRFRYPDVFGSLKFQDVYIAKRPVDAKTSSGEVNFEGDKVKVNVLANCPNDKYIKVNGTTEIKEVPFAKFNISSSNSIDLAFAHKILIPVHEIIGFQLGPLPFMEVAGTGEISLKTEGTRKEASLNGYFKTANAEASLYGLNTKLYKGKMNLLFKGKKIIFNDTTGIVEGVNARIDGQSDIDGNLDLYVKILDVDAKRALNVAKTSQMVLELLNGGKFLDTFTNPEGKIDFNLHIFGKADKTIDLTNFSNLEPSENLKSKGTITFKNNSLNIFPEIKASNISGLLNFSDFADMDLNASIYSSPFKITGKISPDIKASENRKEQPQIVDLTFKSKEVLSKDLYDFFYLNQEGFNSKNKIDKNLYDFLNKIKFKFALNVRAKGRVNPDDTILDMKKFNLDGYAVGMNYKGSDLNFNSGDLRFSGQKILFRNLDCVLFGANVLLNGNIDKIFDYIFVPNLDFKLISFPLSKIELLPDILTNNNVKKILSDFKDFKGALTGKFNYNNVGFNGDIKLADVSFYDNKREMPVVINSGDAKFSNSSLKLNALNILYGATPLYLEANLNNLVDKPLFNVFVSTNLNEESIDKLINPFLEFPIKVKGEFALRGRLRGTFDNYTTFLNIILNPDSDLYYMGANFGDISNKREINSRFDFKNNEINIKNIAYSKFILSQNNKQTPYEMIKVSGGLKTSDTQNKKTFAGGDILLSNLRLQTPNPAPARLLNIFFKKSVLKQGTFTSDMILNGSLKTPKARGALHFSNIDIPLYETNIKDIDLVFNENLINAVVQGMGLGSDIKLSAEIANKSTLPVTVNYAEIESNKISLTKLSDGLLNISKAQKTTTPPASQQFSISPGDFEIKKGKISAKEIYYNNIKASDLYGDFKHTKDGVFLFSDVVFNIAGGKISSTGSYEFNSSKFTIKSEINDCDANILATDILGVKNQIFGKTNGKIIFSGSQLNSANSINNMKADVDFAIYDGKMPKLGSLEYLLRAGNLIKSGLLGFTINNVIEILIPYRTGEFKRISGNFIVDDGKLDKLNIYSQGENLSIYTTGNYDISSSIGNFEVVGKLSTKISNLLGPFGNASVNSLLNILSNDKINKTTKENIIHNVDKIPDIASPSQEFRLFAVKILGDLNSDNYVKSFNWLN